MSDEHEWERVDSRLLHFEDDDPAEWDVRFVNLDDALAWLRKMGYNLGEWEGVAQKEEWIPTGFIEEQLEVFEGFEYVGQLVRLREVCPKCERPDTVQVRKLYDDEGDLVAVAHFCNRCGTIWNSEL